MQRQTEKLWREEKYRVMFHSQAHYNAIRILMREQQPYDIVHAKIQEALRMTPTNGSMHNAIQHMWGYFKKQATEHEKNEYKELIASQQYDTLLHFLSTLAIKYDVRYLQESRILYFQE